MAHRDRPDRRRLDRRTRQQIAVVRPSAIVVGAGIAGLAAAVALKQAQYDVTVVDRAPELAPAGAALSLWSNAMTALDALGAAAPVVQQAAPITKIVAATAQGRAIMTVLMESSFTPHLATRAMLQSALLSTLGQAPVLASEICAVSQPATHASVQLAGSDVLDADLVVVADGIWSATAASLLGTTPYAAGYGGVVALSYRVPDPIEPGAATEYWGVGDRFGLFDLGGDRAYWFYMRDGPNSLPPQHTELFTFAQNYPSAVARAIEATPPGRLIPFDIHAKRPPRRLGRGRIICVGDAAHAVEPNLGQGACQALEDAVALGAVAQVAAPGEVLERFEALRLKRIVTFVRASAQARLLAQPRSTKLGWVLRQAARAIPDAIHARQVTALHRMPDYSAVARSL